MNPIKRNRSNIENCRNFFEKLNQKAKGLLELSKEVDNLLYEYSQTLEIPEASCLHKIEFRLKKEFSEIADIKEANELRLLAELSHEVKVSYADCTIIWNELYIKVNDFIHQLEFDSEYLYFIERGEKWTELWIYDTEESIKTTRLIDTPESLSNKTCVVQLPNSELFCFGNGPSSGFCCIIDLVTCRVKKHLPYGRRSECLGGVYYKGFVYIFGGWEAKFDLIESRWLKSERHLEASPGCSCVVFKEAILICGPFHNKVYKYDLAIESYSALNSPNLRLIASKLLFRGNSRIYLFQEPGTVLESDYENEYTWSTIRTAYIQYYERASWKKVGNSVFISLLINQSMLLFRFDLLSKNFEKLDK
ncbi:unnamed protein product [Blepharisma stoltei]|uniref:Uncharacterized protein n=1 Tax=Blepharisma stoltei TaxID=1481888 RepID=A0AAU9I6M7_9CILI|nr:unnamed protein product [Blepharisma stoltei]